MALVSDYTRTSSSLLGQTRSIKSSLKSTQKSINNINKVFERRTRIRSSIFKTRQLVNNRKLEAIRRKEQRDAIDAAKFSIAKTPNPGTRLRNSGKSFLGRILDFIASLAIGWILSNLPIWIKYGQAFVKRVNALWSSLTGFVNGVGSFISSFGNTLLGVLGDIAAFNFANIPSTVENNIDGLENSINDMVLEFEKGFSLFKQPLIDESEMEEPTQPTPQEQSGASVPYGAPGAQVGPSMTATGGTSASPYIYSGFRTSGRPRHNGIDISGGPWSKVGNPISVIKPGVVADRGVDQNGWGNFVVVKHDDGTYSLYGHLSQINVNKGDKIENKAGAAKVIGKLGSTGRSEGPHLHFELGTGWNGGTLTGHMNPSPYIDSYTRIGGDVKVTAPAAISPTAQPQQTLMGQPAPKGGTLSTDQLVALAKQVGFNQQNAVIAAAVAKAESGGGSGKLNNTPSTGDLSYGLWQINMIDRLGPSRLKQFGISSYEQLYDPLTNARAAFILSGGSNFSPWSVYKSVKYKSFLPEAQKAAGIAPGQFTAMQQQNVPGSITPSNEGEVVFAQFPSSGAAVPGGMEGSSGGYGGGGGSSQVPPSSKSEGEVLNNFIKNKLLVELSYL